MDGVSSNNSAGAATE